MTPSKPERETTEELLGGRVNQVIRIGATVRRKTGPWTPTVHALLTHLASRNFDAAPRAHGIDECGREILDYMPGKAGAFPLPQVEQTDAAILAYGALLRRYHDATVGFEIPQHAVWFLPQREPTEVICHGDLAPDNCIFRDDLPVALIDFDVAHPGPRVWDLGYAACCFAALQAPASEQDSNTVLQQQGHRLRLLCDGYELDDTDRIAVIDNARERLVHLAAFIETKAAEGVQAFADSLAAGHHKSIMAAADYIASNRTPLIAATLNRCRRQPESPFVGARRTATDLTREQLSRAFTEDMFANYRYLVSSCGYRADQFLHLIVMEGAVEAANKLLALPAPPGGFYRLKDLGQLGRSVEACIQRPKYTDLFSDEQRRIARDRLESCLFDVEGFLSQHPEQC